MDKPTAEKLSDSDLESAFTQSKTQLKDAESIVATIKANREVLSKELRKRKLLKAHGLE